MFAFASVTEYFFSRYFLGLFFVWHGRTFFCVAEGFSWFGHSSASGQVAFFFLFYRIFYVPSKRSSSLVFLLLAEFYRVLLGFTGFYWVLPSFTGFYWVLPSFTGFYLVLLGFTGFYLVLLCFTGFYWVLLGFT